MKKVGILTHWTSLHNYGQKLQAYALESYLKQEGLEPSLIKYRWDGLWWRPLLLYRYISTGAHYIWGLITRNKNWSFRKLDYFSHKYLNITHIKPNFKQLIKYCKRLSVLITGSDQVWRTFIYYDKNKTIHYDALDAFTLNIPCQALKISYAASLGHFFPPKECEDAILSRIRKLDAISVREQNLSDYLSANGIKNVVVPDPVFLISKDCYIQLAEKYFYNRKYKCRCFFYSLDNASYLSMNDVANFLFQVFRTDYIHVSGSNGKKTPQTDFPTVAEWLSYIGNSNLIITNSFHCVAFSIIFNTPFYYIPLLPEEDKTDDRIKNLLDFLGLQNREIKVLAELEKKLNSNFAYIDWSVINRKLSEYSEIGKLFLNEVIKD